MNIEFGKSYRVSMFDTKTGIRRQIGIIFKEDGSVVLNVNKMDFTTPEQLKEKYPNFFISSRYPEFSQILAKNGFVNEKMESYRVNVKVLFETGIVDTLRMKVNFLDENTPVIESTNTLFFSPEELEKVHPTYTINSNNTDLLQRLKNYGYKTDKTNDLSKINIAIPNDVFDSIKKEAAEKNLSFSRIVSDILVEYYKK